MAQFRYNTVAKSKSSTPIFTTKILEFPNDFQIMKIRGVKLENVARVFCSHYIVNFSRVNKGFLRSREDTHNNNLISYLLDN
jgi:hypothetical protein